MSIMKVLPACLPLCTVISIASIDRPLQAGTSWVSIEQFNCGELGTVTLRSKQLHFSSKAGHTVAAAQIEIPKRKIRQNGVLHSVMAGNDRTFTRRESDMYSQVDATSPANPVMMNVQVGAYFYGKHRQQVTLVLLNEAHTCIPEK